MLLRRSIALDCLRKILPPIDEDQRLTLLHAPFKGTTLFGGELAKLQEANTKRADLRCVPYAGSALCLLFSYVSDKKKVFLTGRVLRNLVAVAGDRAVPCQPPLSLGLDSLRKATRLYLLQLPKTPINVRRSPGMTPLKPLEKVNVSF